MPKKCVHIIGAPVHSEELCAVTIPRIQRYAEAIGADVNIIGGSRVFPDYPVSYERMQIFAAGRGYQWNICIDADILIAADTRDVTDTVPRDQVGIIMNYAASAFFSVDNRYFIRGGRDFAPVQSVVVSSDWTHDVWEPLRGVAGSHLAAVKNLNQFAEYALALNFAKFNLKFSGAFPGGSRVFRAIAAPDGSKSAAALAQEKAAEWKI
jgi:hypothetical protein